MSPPPEKRTELQQPQPFFSAGNPMFVLLHFSFWNLSVSDHGLPRLKRFDETSGGSRKVTPVPAGSPVPVPTPPNPVVGIGNKGAPDQLIRGYMYYWLNTSR